MEKQDVAVRPGGCKKVVNKRETKNIKEKQHRLPKEFYRGEVSISLTMCLKSKSNIFMKAEITNVFINILKNIATVNRCIIPVYCFMPDHQHMIITGAHKDADLLKVANGYKQKTGFWMSRNRINTKWQKDFYDHILLRAHYSLHVILNEVKNLSYR